MALRQNYKEQIRGQGGGVCGVLAILASGSAEGTGCSRAYLVSQHWGDGGRSQGNVGQAA